MAKLIVKQSQIQRIKTSYTNFSKYLIILSKVRLSLVTLKKA